MCLRKYAVAGSVPAGRMFFKATQITPWRVLLARVFLGQRRRQGRQGYMTALLSWSSTAQKLLPVFVIICFYLFPQECKLWCGLHIAAFLFRSTPHHPKWNPCETAAISLFFFWSLDFRRILLLFRKVRHKNFYLWKQDKIHLIELL